MVRWRERSGGCLDRAMEGVMVGRLGDGPDVGDVATWRRLGEGLDVAMLQMAKGWRWCRCAGWRLRRVDLGSGSLTVAWRHHVLERSQW